MALCCWVLTDASRYRDACRSAILPDLASSGSSDILQAQWEMHTRVRARFVQALSKVGQMCRPDLLTPVPLAIS